MLINSSSLKNSRGRRWIFNEGALIGAEAKLTKGAKYKDFINVSNASLHNLNKFSAKNTVSALTCIAGVSGSGKSTLVNHIIYEGLSGYSKDFIGSVKTDKKYEEVILIDQTTVSKTPRSNPILYIDGWSPIKEALGRTEECKLLGYLPGDFHLIAEMAVAKSAMALAMKL